MPQSTKILDTHDIPFSSTKQGNKNALDVSIAGPLTGFGEMEVAESTPLAQIDAVYGLRDGTDTQNIVGSGSGSATVTFSTIGGQFVCATGTDTAGSAVIYSKRNVRYRPGEGIKFKGTAVFDTPKADSNQRFGSYALGNELAFGYKDTDFGIWHRTGGRPEIYYLSINTATGNQTLTIELDGTGYDVSVTGASRTTVAYEIAQAAATFTGWELDHVNQSTTSRVIFASKTVGERIGAFSVTTTGGAATTSASMIQDGAGAPNVDTFVTQGSWNIDTLESNTFGSFILDPSKGNVYQIGFKYLGYGSITYSVENPNTGLFTPVHQIQFPNQDDQPSMDNPIMGVGWTAENTGNTTNITVKGASAEGSVQGQIVPFRNPRGENNSATGVDTAINGILGIRVGSESEGRINLGEVFPYLVTSAVDGNKPALIGIYINPTVTGQENWVYVDHDISIVEVNKTPVVLSGASAIVSAAVPKVGGAVVDLKALNVVLARHDVLYVACAASSGTTDVSVGITWLED